MHGKKQERLRALSHRIGREHNNRRSLLEPPAVVTNVSEEFELDLDDDKGLGKVEELNVNKKENKNSEDSDTDVEECHLSVNDAKGIEISPVASESLIS